MDIIIILSKCNLFSLWYGWEIVTIFRNYDAIDEVFSCMHFYNNNKWNLKKIISHGDTVQTYYLVWSMIQCLKCITPYLPMHTYRHFYYKQVNQPCLFSIILFSQMFISVGCWCKSTIYLEPEDYYWTVTQSRICLFFHR